MHPTRLVVVTRAVAPVLLLLSTTARGRPRPHFEPTDLDLEASGVVELDLQVGEGRP